MKSLNRTLSLVLVLCMVFGLFGVASAATKFTDASTVKYTEAVNVMTGIGVIAGMGDGTFQPTSNLTREQAAKIICYLTVGKTVADALKADVAPFKDVAVDRWSAGYIAYCVKSGVLTGLGDGTFAPTANVTGYQFAKMLLVALGYDATKEGFTGSAWSINVAKTAYKTGLFEGNDAFDGNKAVNREEACLYAFNTLIATKVEYKTAGTSITVGGTTIVTGGSTATAIARTTGTDYKGSAEGATGTLEFCEEHFSKLRLSVSTDGFKRTANKWYYGTVQTADTLIGTYGAAATYKYVVADPLTYNTLAKIKTAVNANLAIDAAGTAGNGDYTTVYVNGDEITAQNGAGVIADNYTPNFGDIIEFYVTTGTNNVANIVITRYTSARVASNPTNIVSAADKAAGVSYYIALADTTATATKDTQIPGFNASTYVKDAIIAVAVNNAHDILNSYVATKVTGALNAYTGAAISSATTLTVGGTKYPVSAVADNNLVTADFKTGNYALYLTKEGIVVRADTISATVNLTDVYYVPTAFCAADTTYGSGNYTVYAQAVTLDGTVSNVFIGALAIQTAPGGGYTVPAANTCYSVTNGVATAYANGATIAAGDTYYVVAKGVVGLTTGLYTFAPVTNETYKAATPFATAGSYTITTGIAAADLKTTSTKYGANYLTSSTKYLLVKGSLSTIKTASFTGGITFGNANFSSTGTVIATKDAYGNLIASYVIIPATTTTLDSAASTDLLYAFNTNYTVVANGKTVKMYKMDGTAVDVTIASGATVTAGTFYTYGVNAEGVYTLSSAAESADTVIYGTTGFTSARVAGVTYTGRYGNTISGTNAGNAPVADVEAASAVVIDLRLASDKAVDKYTGDITTIDALETARTIGCTGITFDAFFTSTGMKVVFITAVDNA